MSSIRKRFQCWAIAVFAVAGIPSAALAERNPSAAPPMRKAILAAEGLNAGLAPNRLMLGALASERLATIRAKNASADPHPLQIGVVRDLPARAEARSVALTWSKVPGGMAMQWRLSVAGSRALRVRLDVRGSAAGVRVRFASALRPLEVTGEPLEAVGPFWGPVVAGGEAIVEIFAPDGVSPREVDVVVAQVADHFASPLDADFAAKHEWLAQPCQADLVCESASDPVLARAGSASIKITWVHEQGAYACSATLLNPADGSFRPYIYTAAHCLDAQAPASNLISHWFYDKASCGGADERADAVQVGGGAQWLAADEQLDASFLRLNRMPPPGATFAGWDSDAPSTGEDVTAIHHANGEVTKVSHATVLSPPAYPYVSVAWNRGIVQGGSSGSGLFTRLASPNGDLLFRGGLSAAAASCAAPGTGIYSRIDRFWPRIAPYLSTSAATANATGLWWNAADPGWGLTLNQQNDKLFGVLFAYDADGRPMWLVASDMRKQADAAFAGALYRMSNTGRPEAGQVGTLRVSLSSANAGELTYSVDGATSTKQISRQVYGSHAPICTASAASRAQATNYQDLWSDASDPGWGLAIAHQDDTLFVTLFTYDEAGRGVWYVASSVARGADGGFAGTLYRTTRAGGAVTPEAVGEVRLDFPDGESARATMTVLGRTSTRAITRQVFDTLPPVCH